MVDQAASDARRGAQSVSGVSGHIAWGDDCGRCWSPWKSTVLRVHWAPTLEWDVNGVIALTCCAAGRGGAGRNWTLEQKLAILGEMARCNNITTFSREHDIRTSLLYTWCRELRYALQARQLTNSAEPMFVPVVAEHPRAVFDDGSIEVEPGGAVAPIGQAARADLAAAVLQACRRRDDRAARRYRAQELDLLRRGAAHHRWNVAERQPAPDFIRGAASDVPGAGNQLPALWLPLVRGATGGGSSARTHR